MEAEGRITRQPGAKMKRTKARFDTIPARLRDREQWVCWRLEKRDGKPTKIPLDCAAGKPASTTDPRTWHSFDEAVASLRKGCYSGLGFVFTENDPFAGIDLDHVRDSKTGEVEPWASVLVKRFNSYAELSQSGTGAHIIVRGKVPGNRRRSGKIEMYDTARFFVCTGLQLANTPDTVESRQNELNELYTVHFGADERDSSEVPPKQADPAAPVSLSGQELIEKAKAAKNGVTFSALWRGDWKRAGYNSHSEADAALLGMLRFWTGGDKNQSFALFSQSGLNRKKWERKDYKEKTWAKVSSGEIYSAANELSRSSCSQIKRAAGIEIDDVPECKSFPIDALPEPHRSLVGHGAESIGCDPALVALPLLAATSGAIGNSRRIMLKRGWCEPAVLWAVTVALSGDRKSPAFELGIDGLLQIEERAFAEHRAAQEEYEEELHAWKDGGGSGPKPKPPIAKRVIVRDITVEKLAEVLSENPRGLLLARDELSAWIGGFDRYAKGEESAHWLEFYRAGKVTTDRKTGDNGKKTMHVPRAAVSITGTIQPGTLERLLERKHFDNGLAARLLLAWPPRHPRQWNESEIYEDGLLVPVRRVFEKLYSLSMGSDAYGNPEPIDLEMTPEGKKRWVQFYNEHGAEMHEMVDERLASAWSKLEGTTARFALLSHCVRAAALDESLQDPAAIDKKSIEAAITLVEWFKNETRRIYQHMGESEEAKYARGMLAFIRSKGKATIRDISKGGIGITRNRDVKRVAEGLVESGYAKWEETEKGKRGRPTSYLVPTDCEIPKIRNSQNIPVEKAFSDFRDSGTTGTKQKQGFRNSGISESKNQEPEPRIEEGVI